MSRSYRKPWVTDGYKGSRIKQYHKNQANKKVRRSENVPDGMMYRKYYDPWKICDYKWYVDENDSWFREQPWKYNRK